MHCFSFVHLRLVVTVVSTLTTLSTSAAADVKKVDDVTQQPDRQQALILLGQVAAAIDKTLIYFEKHVDKVNLDGIIGLREIEGQLSGLLARYWSHLPLGMVTHLRKMQAHSGKVAQLASDAVKLRTPEYYLRLNRIILPNFWNVFYPQSTLKMELAQTPKENNVYGFDEKTSDDCIIELVGNERNNETCNISKRCWDTLINQEGLSGYDLTHQVFYLLNGISANCLTNLTFMARFYSDLEQSQQPLTKLLDGYCANVYAEAFEFEQRSFPPEIRDLFMEQIGLCGEAGYTQMAQWRWMPLVLSWQRDSGCYGFFPTELVDPRNFEKNTYGKSKRGQARSKRVEEMMEVNGCLSHRTSVAQSALLIFARRLIESVLQ